MAGDDRRRRGPHARLRLPAAPLGAWHRAAFLALGAFAVFACAGLAIIARYTMLAAAVLSIFVALALLGWRLLEPAIPGGVAGSSSPRSSSRCS